VWDAVPGNGVVHTYTITRRAFHWALSDFLPYVVAVIDLDDSDGVRLIGNVVKVDPEQVRIGMAVHVEWDDLDPCVTVARFAPA
jgi:uncharacterized OB-fold protein